MDSSMTVASLGRLRWQCRRGMKELDLLLTRYLDRRYSGAPPLEQQAFRRLLEAQDPLIHAYCMGSEPPPPHLAALIGQIAANCAADR